MLQNRARKSSLWRDWPDELVGFGAVFDLEANKFFTKTCIVYNTELIPYSVQFIYFIGSLSR
jgi:hypothetical protein